MSKKSAVSQNDKTKSLNQSSDIVWAALSISSLPIAALSFTALGLHPALSFVLGVVVTFLIIMAEALVRGKLWIFQDSFQHIFGHQDTAFRILVVSGGLLLILQTFLIIEVIKDPNMDHIMLNLILRKQCQTQGAPLADLICPIFQKITPQYTQELPLLISMEQAAKNHLLPNQIFGSCAVLPLESFPETLTDKLDVRFFAYCLPWTDQNKTGHDPVMRIIKANFLRDSYGFYNPLNWEEDQQSPDYLMMSADQKLLIRISSTLLERKESMLKSYAADNFYLNF